MLSDVVVIGGGVIGLSIAYELAGQGIKVTLLEQGALGQEASWAGAGMLPPGQLKQAQTPQAKLTAFSAQLWPTWSTELHQQTGIDNGFWNCGSLHVQWKGQPDYFFQERSAQQAQGITIEEYLLADLHKDHPYLSPEITAAYLTPDSCQVRNPRHLKALIAGCASRGVTFHAQTPVTNFQFQEGKLISVKTPSQHFYADKFCLATGAWSAQLLEPFLPVPEVVPVRGQIVLLSTQVLPFQQLIEVGSSYLVPRRDGLILVGTTEEYVGFDKQNTAEALVKLLDFATQLVPELVTAEHKQSWAGLRPSSIDQLPYLGKVPKVENLFLATGHFRSGLCWSPATAVLIRELMLDQAPSLPLIPYFVDRGYPRDPQ